MLALSFYCSPHAFHIPTASRRPFLFLPSPPLHPSIALFHSTRAESTGHGPDNEYSNFETRLGRWRARRAIQKFKSDGLSDTRCRGTRCIIDYAYDPPRYISSGHSLISNRTIYIYIKIHTELRSIVCSLLFFLNSFFVIKKKYPAYLPNQRSRIFFLEWSDANCRELFHSTKMLFAFPLLS